MAEPLPPVVPPAPPPPVPPTDPNYVSPEDLKTWEAVNAKFLRRGWSFVVSQGWLSGNAAKIVAVIVSALVLVFGGGTATYMLTRPKAVEPAPAIQTGDIARAMDKMGDKMSQAIDKQTAVIAKGPDPAPKEDEGVLPKEVSVSEAASITAKTDKPVRWLIPATKFASVRVNNHTVVIFPKSEGEFSFGASVDKAEPVWCKVTVGVNPDPTPKPPEPQPPGPKPPEPKPPEPPQASTPLWIVVVQHAGTEKSWGPQFFADGKLADQLLSGGHKWKIVDKEGRDTTGKVSQELAPFVAQARGKILPQFFLVDPATKVAKWTGPAPKNAAELSKVIADNGG